LEVLFLLTNSLLIKVNKTMGNYLIGLGFLIIFLGLILNLISKFNLPVLPGDILIQKENFTFYFPIVTSILLSILLTIILNLFK
jgi:hypothetical protein